ncbi:MAG: hypothetical protein WBD40_15165 [Tepidisphaeraceae bacterium]
MRTHRESLTRWFRFPSLVAAAVAALAAGCASGPERQEQPDTIAHIPPERTLNADIVEMSLSQQVRDGAAIGRTIYPHHFVIGGAELNLIGERQLDALLPREADRKVEINVLRGDTPEDLYHARLDVLRKRSLAVGHAADRIAFVDELPDGDGISSERVLRLAAQEQKRSEQGGRGGGGMSTNGQESSFQPSGTGGSGSNRGGGSSGGGGSGGGGGYSR